jgi:hypothetical protein
MSFETVPLNWASRYRKPAFSDQEEALITTTHYARVLRLRLPDAWLTTEGA